VDGRLLAPPAVASATQLATPARKRRGRVGLVLGLIGSVGAFVSALAGAFAVDRQPGDNRYFVITTIFAFVGFVASLYRGGRWARLACGLAIVLTSALRLYRATTAFGVVGGQGFWTMLATQLTIAFGVVLAASSISGRPQHPGPDLFVACPSCGSAISGTARFCATCGAERFVGLR
jgi:hypothetical protein